MAKRGRPKSARQAVKSTFIRLTQDELELVERALAIQADGVIGGESISVAAFGRALMLREAAQILKKGRTYGIEGSEDR